MAFIGLLEQVVDGNSSLPKYLRQASHVELRLIIDADGEPGQGLLMTTKAEQMLFARYQQGFMLLSPNIAMWYSVLCICQMNSFQPYRDVRMIDVKAQKPCNLC